MVAHGEWEYHLKPLHESFFIVHQSIPVELMANGLVRKNVLFPLANKEEFRDSYLDNVELGERDHSRSKLVSI